ncbi:acyl-homoserine-lactone synthase [Arsenophonus nasoniae]|uniref:acyl-homoserine-lactone synthase n=1 Tax=Arsenophonus nasoniae TaxID=638 RepID=UPI00387A746E
MIKFIITNYNEIDKEDLKDFFRLRKKIFKDRLNWLVKCKNGMEFDEYDNTKTIYLLGKVEKRIICGCRFIDMKYHNMCVGTFYKYFNEMKIRKGKYIEITRVFIDKDRISYFGLNDYPVNLSFFLNIRNFANNLGFNGIYAVVTHHFLNILIKSGWKVEIQQKGISEKNENIYLIIMPTREENILSLKNLLIKKLR